MVYGVSFKRVYVLIAITPQRLSIDDNIPMASHQRCFLVLVAVLLSTFSALAFSSSPSSPPPPENPSRPPSKSPSNMDELQQKTSEWNIAGKKRKDRPTPQRKPWKLPSVKYIPPPPDGDPQFEPFMLLLVGLPGSGKSTFAKALIEAMPYKFTRINQDELGNRQKCEAKARMALDEGKCPIIDRCNFDQSQRQKWFDIAKEKGGIPVDCITLHLPVGLCIRRCEQRTNHETVAPSQARAIINKIKQQYRPPGKKEPFRRLDYVKDSDAFNSILEQCLDR